MEFPFGGHHHHHHRRDDAADAGADPGAYPPPGHRPYGDSEAGPFYGGNVQQVGHEPGGPGYGYGVYPPPPPAYGAGPGAGGGEPYGHGHPHHHQPYGGQPYPPVPAHAPANQAGQESWGNEGAPAGQKTVRVFTKAEEGYSLTIRDGAVVLARSNPGDEYQHWIKDMKYSTRVKDEEGFPAFALVNKVTGEALKHSIGATHPVRLVPYNQTYLDESVLWTESRDLGDSFRCIRMVNNIRLNFDAFHGDEDHGGVRDGTTLVLWEWLKGKNQRWKIAPH